MYKFSENSTFDKIKVCWKRSMESLSESLFDIHNRNKVSILSKFTNIEKKYICRMVLNSNTEKASKVAATQKNTKKMASLSSWFSGVINVFWILN